MKQANLELRSVKTLENVAYGKICGDFRFEDHSCYEKCASLMESQAQKYVCRNVVDKGTSINMKAICEYSCTRITLGKIESSEAGWRGKCWDGPF